MREWPGLVPLLLPLDVVRDQDRFKPDHNKHTAKDLSQQLKYGTTILSTSFSVVIPKWIGCYATPYDSLKESCLSWRAKHESHRRRRILQISGHSISIPWIVPFPKRDNAGVIVIQNSNNISVIPDTNIVEAINSITTIAMPEILVDGANRDPLWNTKDGGNPEHQTNRMIGENNNIIIIIITTSLCETKDGEEVLLENDHHFRNKTILLL